MKRRFGLEQAGMVRRSPALLAIAIAVSLGLGCERSPPRVEAFEAPDRELAADATALVALNESERGAGNVAKRRELTWTFDEGAFGATDVVVSIPVTVDAAARFPVLIALHGRGESLKGSRRGARGWLDDYDLDRAMQRLSAPPLRTRDFQGYVSRERLRHINRALAEQPYSGLIVVCPFLPDVLRRENAFKEAEPLAAFIVDVLLPRVYAKTPALATAASTGIDGVSLGGRAALLVGFTRPRAFGAVGALQAAIDGSEIERFAELGARALADNPSLSLRLLTSDKDHFLRVNERLSEVLKERGVQHRYSRVQGTHSYRFNRGPGAIEMLLFHDRVLRGTAWD
jgi:iron(III)-salmochelin esterase